MKTFKIYTDGSYSGRYKISAYAFWVEGPDFHVKEFNHLDASHRGSTAAEIVALIKAVEKINEIVPEAERSEVRIVAHIDSLDAINAIRGRVTDTQFAAVANDAIKIVSPYRLDTVKITAHRDKIVNEDERRHLWCDFHAREAYRRRVYELRSLQSGR